MPLPRILRDKADKIVSPGPAITPKNCVNPMLPRNKAPIKIAIMINVLRALTHSGGLNAGVPLLIASMPVNAVQPAENACSTRTIASGSRGGGATAAIEVGVTCMNALTTPYNSIPKNENRYRYTGTAIAVPDSRNPRKFNTAINTNRPSASHTRYAINSGKADVMAATPAVRLTAAVNT